MSAVDRLAQIDQRQKSATIGPWVTRLDAHGEYPNDVLTEWEDGRRGQLVIAEHAGPDASFIAASRTDVPDLVAALRAVKEWIDTRGVYVGDENSEYYRGYRQAQREAIFDAGALSDALDTILGGTE